MVTPDSPPATLRRALTGMWGAGRRWIAWSGAHQTAHPLIWVHSPSVGETLAAQPVLERLRARVTTLGVVLTHTSPSVEPWGGAGGIDHRDYLPFPLPAPGAASIARMVKAVRPDLLVTSRGELWPSMATAARTLGIPVAIVAGSLRDGARRLGPVARLVLKRAYRSVALAAVPEEVDRRNWTRLGIPADRIHVVGDPRDDYVLFEPLNPLATNLAPWAAGRVVAIFGSIEPDEAQLAVEAASLVRQRYPDLGVLAAPHDPGEAAATAVRWEAAGFQCQIWPNRESSPVRRTTAVVVIGARALLRSAYRFATVAYVGGGFNRTGPHSVSEPAAFGLPCVVGPTASSGAESRRLVGPGARPIRNRLTAGRDTAAIWLDWLKDPEGRRRAGLAARAVLRGGAADRTAALLAGLMERKSGVGHHGA